MEKRKAVTLLPIDEEGQRTNYLDCSPDRKSNELQSTLQNSIYSLRIVTDARQKMPRET